MKYFSCLLFFLTVAFCKAQTILLPGDKAFETNWLANSKNEMTYFLLKGGEPVEIGSFSMQVNFDKMHYAVYTALSFLHSNEQWLDTSISDINTFSPVYRSSFNKDKEFVIKYGKEITGYYYEKNKGKRYIIKESVSGSFFDGYIYPYLLKILRFNAGYKKEMSVYEYRPGSSTNIHSVRIEEVKNNIYSSSVTGEHKVWQVSVWEEVTDDSYQYYIDKETHRLWKIEIQSKGQHLLLIDKETDYNPFSVKFDKDETMKMITGGNAVISGQAFARDNQNGGLLKGMAVLNINKKQYAPTGTSVILIPYTSYFKEWVKLNKASRKNGQAIPLPAAAAACIKVASVYDNEGHFEFVNLMPGEYLLYSEFSYVHTATHTEVVGYTDTYINGMFQGSAANTSTYQTSGNASATVQKIITIANDRETVSVKLKKTL